MALMFILRHKTLEYKDFGIVLQDFLQQIHSVLARHLADVRIRKTLVEQKAAF